MKLMNALMEGQRIELEDRRNCTFGRLVHAKKAEDSDSDDSCCRGYVSEVSHNYSFRFARPRLSNVRTQNKLAITQLELPTLDAHCAEKAKRTKTKASKRRCNKLGLKPIKLPSRTPAIDDSRQCIDEEAHAANYGVNDDVDFDCDALRWIGRIAQNVGEEKKKIRFAPSTPPSPRTVQVIRVDVRGRRKDHRRQDGRASEDDEDDYGERFRRDYGLDRRRSRCRCGRDCCRLGGLVETPRDDLELVVMCRKLVLSPKDRSVGE